MYKQNIQRLAQTSLILSLEHIANEVQLNNPKLPEMHVLQMVVSKKQCKNFNLLLLVFISLQILLYMFMFQYNVTVKEANYYGGTDLM